MNRYQYELYHHGIKGMKWGVRRFQKKDGSLTPAGKNRYETRQAKRDKRAEKYETRAAKYQRDIDELKSKGINSPYIDKLEKKRDKNLENAERKRQGKLTKGEKAVLVGASVVAAYATFKLADSGEFNRLAAKGKAFISGSDLGFKKDISLSDKNMSSDEIMSRVVSRINPNYGDMGTKNNCRRCTFAYEMSRRGFDVKATKSTKATGQNGVGLYNATHTNDKVRGGTIGLFGKMFSEQMKTGDIDETKYMGSAVKHLDSETGYSKSIFKALSGFENGARGELSVSWKYGGAHSIAWEIINGKPVIFDCQTGTRFLNPEEFSSYGDLVSSANLIRLDNIDLDNDFLLRWLKNA